MKRYALDLTGLRKSRHDGKRRAFTLTEMAIVIAIIGTIVGGLFVAAEAARYRHQLGVGGDELGQIVVNMRSLYAGQNTSPPVAALINFPGATFVAKMVFPPEMLVPALPTTGVPAAGTVANNPWDQTVATGSAQIQLCPIGSACAVPLVSPVAQFAVRYLNVPAEVCTDLLMKNSLPGPDTGLLQVRVGVGGVTASVGALPVSAAAAASACYAGSVYTIDWYYSLGS